MQTALQKVTHPSQVQSRSETPLLIRGQGGARRRNTTFNDDAKSQERVRNPPPISAVYSAVALSAILHDDTAVH